MSDTQSSLATFGTGNSSETDDESLPEPELIRNYAVTGRLVNETDTQESAPQREDSPYALSIYHYPNTDSLWNTQQLFRICFGASQLAWFDIDINTLKSFTRALNAYDTTNFKFNGGHYTTSTNTATATEGVIGVTVDVSAIADSKILTLQVGDTIGAGATAELSPAQTIDFQHVFSELNSVPPSELQETSTLPVSCGDINVSGENIRPEI